MKNIKICLFILSIIAVITCGPIPDIREFEEIDLKPPVLESVFSIENNQIKLILSEPTFIEENSMSISPGLEITEIKSIENYIIITTGIQIPGNKYTLNTEIKDTYNNSVQILADFYGYNSEIPELKINEFTTRGSPSHPDMVELKIFSDGNMGGIVIYDGTPEYHKNMYVFPPCTVKKDDFIIIHFKPQNIDEEINETLKKNISGGLDASDEAYDIWIKDGTGLTGNNGAVSLYERPGGKVIDGVLYSNRTSESDETYMGFGTANAMNQALELCSNNGWLKSKEAVCPEDAVNPDNSTSTRSICRNKTDDTDSKEDWYIVPTRGYSFGKENTEEVYIP